jgi:hypothetical protein
MSEEFAAAVVLSPHISCCSSNKPDRFVQTCPLVEAKEMLTFSAMTGDIPATCGFTTTTKSGDGCEIDEFAEFWANCQLLKFLPLKKHRVKLTRLFNQRFLFIPAHRFEVVRSL